ncbi:type II toxin-antitoxin system PemK/MazF family toxin [Mobiluncus mulieris]|nr:type II toxin-antitoxin system PemK/MazF family toxin [Mobiluncus mulieris]MCU9997454.1 type II toxin-antitoxin system PemK/MazF family toxin [Mobiluncus mulieris]MCV0012797.1 type II toxin-antitoxin system PemK/MazF family toxin [Mobiluncus mulieris]NMW61199.1 type II toxin-antitoxin system PemK/MazF family toxin [Mobiluncus mulieris]NMW82315.1 type II toxin-antitoxin system PemK/MazF family toxin [Mobiluncus mulieris]
MMFHYGDVVWLDFDPSSGHEQCKRRPAVVVSNDSYNRYNNLVMVVPITSRREYPLHVNVGRIETEDGNLIQGWAEIEQLKSLDLEYRHATKAGQLGDEALERITNLVLGCLMEPTMRIERLA